jgi:PAS domain S-box-containing protein
MKIKMDIFNASVLIVDDRDANVQILTRMLVSAGYTSVTSTMNPLEVCELHRSHRYDLILLDLQMPGMDGFQVMEGLKKIEPDGYLPVIVITAYPEYKLRALQAGAKDFINMPFHLPEVLARVHNMLEVRLLNNEVHNYNDVLEQRVRERVAELEDAHRQLRDSELRYREVFENISDGLFLLDVTEDLHFKLVEFNPAQERSVGYSTSEVSGKFVEEAIPEASSRQVIANYRRCVEAGTMISYDEELALPSGSRSFSTTLIPVRDATGRIYRIVGIARDITERKKVENELNNSMHQLEEKELAKTRFFAAAGHDLRQPLTAANLSIDALKFTKPTAAQNQIIKRLDHAMSNFNDLLDALLNVSRLDAGVIKPEFTSINVTAIFNWLKESFAPLASGKHLRFKLHFPMRKAFYVRSDIGLLKSVLMNLVSNAIKFTSKGGIMVSARRRGGDVLFQVWDTGIGIQDEHIEEIFDDFYQINNSQRDRTRGIGLGLSIVKRALALLDGEITCHSQVGRGTVFEFHLPIDNISSNQIQETTTVKSQEVKVIRSFVLNKRFVVVEDDALVLEALSISLKMMGGKVECFDNAEYALQHLNIDTADCYIVDYMLNGSVDGISFLNVLQKRLQKPICAVMMSGDTSANLVRKAELFDWPVLHKPVNLSKLISKLSEQYIRNV